MTMKKTSGGDFPLQQGAGKSFWTLPISGRVTAQKNPPFRFVYYFILVHHHGIILASRHCF
jgi:hypothetical protein